jgi:protein-L-isoaspartate(D-aspartate) O-methyltransferase
MPTATNTPPDALRAQMVDRILTTQHLTPPVEAALRAVERHRYVPDAPIADAYNEQAVITHTFPDGTHLSCASDPTIVAAMLDALDVHPGQRIMEIGAGTGYNAALLATLAGPTGEVTTVDINPDVTAAARRNLDTTGYTHVRVITGDGADGAPEHGPYDRIIVTVGAWDIPHTWWDQLVPGGRLVLPLRWRGTTRAVAFTKRADHWESDWVFLCGFVPMVGQPGEHHATIDPGGLVTLHYDADQNVDVDALQGVLSQDKTAVWSHATVGGEEPFDRIWLHLTAADDGTVRIQADQQAITSGLCTPAIPSRSPALVQDGSLAYFTIRRTDTPGTLATRRHRPRPSRRTARRPHHRTDRRLGPRPHRRPAHARLPDRRTHAYPRERQGHRQAQHPARPALHQQPLMASSANQ